MNFSCALRTVAPIGLALALTTTPVNAEELERGQPTTLIAPSTAFSGSGYGTATTHSWSDGFVTAPARSTEVVELARALRYDPDLIFEWVHDNVRVEPVFGLRKGALGAVIDREGTSFDQVQLALELLQEAGANSGTSIDPRIEIGTLTLTAPEFTAWYGISDARAACEFLAAGGFPARVNNTTNCTTLSGPVGSVEIGHARLSVTIGSTTTIWDPAYKSHTQHVPLDFQSAMGLTQGSTITQLQSGMSSGSQSGLPYVSHLNETALDTTLSSRATALEAAIASSRPTASLRELLGGLEIEPHFETGLANYLSTASKASAGSFTAYASGLTAVPDQYRTSVSLSMRMILADVNYQYEDYIFGSTPLRFYSDEFYGEQFYIRVGNLGHIAPPDDAVYEFDAAIMIGGTVMRAWSDQDTPSLADDRSPSESYRTFDTTLSIDHPYLADSGAYMDASHEQLVVLLEDAVIVTGLGEADPGQLGRLNARLGPERLGSMLLEDLTPWDTNPSDPAGQRSDNTRQRMATNWMVQFSRMAQLQAGVGASRIQHHHSIGFAAADTRMSLSTSQYGGGSVYLSNWSVSEQANTLNLKTSLSVTHLSGDTARSAAVMRSVGASAAVLEGSVLAQLNDAPFVSSVANRFAWANAPAGSHYLTEDTTENAYNYAGPYRFYLLTSAAEVTTFINNYMTFDGAQTTAIVGHQSYRNALSNALVDYANRGFHIAVNQDVFAGPGSRCGHRYPVTVDSSTGRQTNSALCQGSFNRGGAFVGIHPTTGEIAHIVTSRRQYSGGGGSVGHPEEFLEHSPPTGADLLKEQEGLAWSHNVNLQTGQLTFAPGAVLSSGAGDFPYALSFERTYESGTHGPLESPWRHNWDFSASQSGSGMEAMGASRRENAIPSLVAFAAMQDIYLATGTGQTLLRREVGGALAVNWWAEQLRNNVVTLALGGETVQFVRRVDGGFNAPALSLAHLQQTGEREIVRSHTIGGGGSSDSYEWRGGGPLVANPVSFVYTDESGNTVDFEYQGGQYMGPSPGVEDPYIVTGYRYRERWRASTWTFARGMTISFAYATCPPPLTYCEQLVSVTNSLGWGLSFTGDNEFTGPSSVTQIGSANPRSVSFADETVTTDPGLGVVSRFDTVVTASDGEHTRYVVERLVNDANAVHSSSYLTAVYLPEDLNTNGTIGSDNPSFRFTYNALGQVDRFQSLDTATAYVDYDYYIAQGRRGEMLNPHDDRDTQFGDVTYYDADGRTSRSITRDGRETRSQYDGLGRLVETSLHRTSLIGARYFSRSTFGYDANHNQVEVSEHTYSNSSGSALAGAPLTTLSVYANASFPRLVTSQTDPRGNISTFEYDSRGLLTAQNGPSGERTSFVWDTRGLPTEIRSRVTAAPLLERVSTITYTPAGLPDVRTSIAPNSADSIIVDFDWTSYGELERITGPMGAVTEASYDDAGRITEVVQLPGNAAARQLRYGYDRNGRVTAIDRSMDAAGSSWIGSTITYAPNGRAASVADPAGDTTQFAYNTRRWLQTVTDPLGRQTRYDYLRDGQVYCERRAHHDAAQRQTYRRTAYRSNGTRSWTAPALGEPDADCSISDDRAAQYDYRTVYATDVYGRSNRTYYPEASTDTYSDNLLDYQLLDASGNVVQTINRAGVTHVMSYDASNRLVSKARRSGSSGSYTYSEIFTNEYNVAGEVIRAWGPDGRCTEYEFDFAGRMTLERQRLNCGDRSDPNYGFVAATGASNVSLETGYEYDAAGNRTAIIWPQDAGGSRYTARYTYNLFGELFEVCEDADGNGSCERVLSRYTYDRLGNLTEVENGDSATSPVSSMSMAYEVDGDFVRLDHHFSGESTANRDVSFRYGYDAAGQLIAESEVPNAGATRAWTWVATATRSNPQSAHNVLDQPASATVAGTAYTLTWDANGNLISRGVGSAFVHDSENRLISGAVPGHSWSYTYDAGGRRVTRVVDGVTHFAAHAGGMEIANYQVTSSGTVGGEPVWNYQITQRYVPGAGVDQRVAMINTNASGAALSRHYYHVNRLGSVIALVNDATGTVSDHYVYTPFGVEAPLTTSGNPFRYTGRRYDAESGLYYYRARYYWPEIGRFLETDPVGYADQMNLYAYVGNSPLNATDPSGMFQRGDSAMRGVMSSTSSGATSEDDDDTNSSAGDDNPDYWRFTEDEDGNSISTPYYYQERGSLEGGEWVIRLVGIPGVSQDAASVAGDLSQLPLLVAGGASRFGFRSSTGVTGRAGSSISVRAARADARVGLLRRLTRSDGSLSTSRTVARHFEGARSFIPVQALRIAVRYGNRSADPQGVTGQFMYTIRAVGTNGRSGRLEVLVNEQTNIITHANFIH